MGRKNNGKNKSIVYIVILLAAGLFLGRMSGQLDVLLKGIGWIVLLALIALALLFVVAYLKRDKALAALNECDPKTAIPLNEKKIENLRKQTSLSDRKRFQLNIRLNNLAVAYHALGDIAKAVEILESAEVEPDEKKHSIYLVTHHNLAYYNLELGRQQAYEEEWLLIRDFLAELPTELTKQYGGIYPHLEAKQQMLAGKYKKCLEYYEKSVEDEDQTRQSLLSRVITRFELGVIYKELGDVDKAREQLEYVSEHGKEIKVAQEARALLATLSVPEGEVKQDAPAETEPEAVKLPEAESAELVDVETDDLEPEEND